MAKTSFWGSGRLPEPVYLPTPSFGINRALGGRGLASGRIHVYWGPKASGKTSAALLQVAQAQREGKVCGFLDSERAFSDPWAEGLGVDLDALRYSRTMVVEEALKGVMPSLESGEIDVLIVDSVNSLNYESFFDAPESQGMSTYARSSKMFTHKVLSVLQPHQQVIFICQQSMQKSGQQFVAGAAVGSAIEHWASTMIKFRKTGTRKPEVDSNTGLLKKDANGEWRPDGAFKVHWLITKSKQSTYPVGGSYYFNAEQGEIDSIAELAEYAVTEGCVEKSGTWLSLGDAKWQGTAQFAEAMKEDKALHDTIESMVLNVKVEETPELLEAEDDD